MNLSEQVDYINKIKEKVLGYEDYDFVTRNQIYYILFDLKTNLPLLEFRCHGTFRLSIFERNTTKPFMSCYLEDFLSTYFYDMVNPSPEEKVMWRLQFGFDWYF